MNNPAYQPPVSDKEQGPEKLFVVVGPWGVTPFLDPDAAARYPGPRMFELSTKAVVEYIRADLAQPAGELTVERALEELREIAPGSARLRVDQHPGGDCFGVSIYDYDKAAVAFAISDSSLRKCLESVRSWRQTVEKGS